MASVAMEYVRFGSVGCEVKVSRLALDVGLCGQTYKHEWIELCQVEQAAEIYLHIMQVFVTDPSSI